MSVEGPLDCEVKKLKKMATKLALATCQAKRSCVQRGYIEDAYIEHFAGELEGMMDPTMNRGYHARIAAMDLVKDDFQGDQIVVLGAGFDTGYWRREKKGKYFEVDVETVCVKKESVIKRKKLKTDDYVLIPCDLSDVGALRDALLEKGLDESKRTLFVAECVLSYLEAATLESLLKWLGSLPEAACVAYDVVAKDDAFGHQMRRNLQGRGWPVLSPAASLEAQKNRFSSFADASAIDMHQTYHDIILATPEERARVNRLEIFDDPDEFKLLMQHYCFVLAANGSLVSELLGPLRRRIAQGPVLDPPLHVETLKHPPLPPFPTTTTKEASSLPPSSTS